MDVQIQESPAGNGRLGISANSITAGKLISCYRLLLYLLAYWLHVLVYWLCR